MVGVGVGAKPTLDFAFAEAARREVPVEAVRAWRCPAHESTGHPLPAGEPARLHEQQAVDVLEAALRDVPADAEVHRRTVEGPAGTVLAGASHHADLLVIGARRHARHFGLQLGRRAGPTGCCTTRTARSRSSRGRVTGRAQRLAAWSGT
ncbi:universal stress protein [Streptomyces sp. NRRL B-24085]|uniref:universal stress protein n=1 Tax=Streptomyces sp. NRRL B-24085 TaxID=1709476 RepID=UPI0006B39BD7